MVDPKRQKKTRSGTGIVLEGTPGACYPVFIETRNAQHRRNEMANKSFRKGQSTYTCRCCGRVTRDTNSEGSIELCAQCYELAGFENMIQDGNFEDSDKQSAIVYF